MKKTNRFKNIKLWIILVAMTMAPCTGLLSHPWDYGLTDIPIHQKSKDPEQVSLVAKGEKIVRLSCVHCHLGSDGKLSGDLFNKTEPRFGEIYAPNITQSKNHGIGSWNSFDIEKMLRTGIKPDGKRALPFMPRYPLLSDGDLEAIIAFLKSDDELVTVSTLEQPRQRPSFLIKMGALFFDQTYKLPLDTIPGPVVQDKFTYGEYLVQSYMHCFSCHSGSLPRIDYGNPEKTPKYLRGGGKFRTGDGSKVKSPSILFSTTDTLGQDLEAFKILLREGKKTNGDYVRYPMHPYPELTDYDIESIHTYLNNYLDKHK